MGYFRGSRNSWQQSLSFKNKLNSKRYVMKFLFKKSRQFSTKRITISCACDCDTKTRKDFVVSRMTHQANLKIWLVCLDITQSNADCKFSGIVTNHVLAGWNANVPAICRSWWYGERQRWLYFFVLLLREKSFVDNLFLSLRAQSLCLKKCQKKLAKQKFSWEFLIKILPPTIVKNVISF